MGTQGVNLDLFIRRLSSEGRVLVLGGLAVIAHGFSRTTKDADVWLEPFASSQDWADHLLKVCRDFPQATLHELPTWTKLEDHQLPDVIEKTGMVRILGLECPLDIFRRPNNFGEEEFNETFGRASPDEDGTWLPDPLDLIVSKEETERDRDRTDIIFLEGKVRGAFGARLKNCGLAEAERLFSRYTDHVVASAAMDNPDPAVKELGRQLLKELARDGNPFAKDLLQGRGISPD